VCVWRRGCARELECLRGAAAPPLRTANHARWAHSNSTCLRNTPRGCLCRRSVVDEKVMRRGRTASPHGVRRDERPKSIDTNGDPPKSPPEEAPCASSRRYFLKPEPASCDWWLCSRALLVFGKP